MRPSLPPPQITPPVSRLFGLTIASDFAIPWAPEAPGTQAADVVIRRVGLGDVQDEDRTALQFDVPGVARYRVAGGREISVWPCAGAGETEIRLYLLGSALGVLLHQRGLLVLHANAIVIDGAAALFMGPSGAGKSTLAAWFSARGYPVLTDDICAVDIGADGQITVLPGLTRLRLADDAASQLAIDVAGGALCPSSGKREIGLPRVQALQPIEPRACYLLSDAAAAEDGLVTPLLNIDAVEMLMANTYRGFALQRLGGSSGHLEACVRLAAQVPCFAVRRAKDWACFDTVAKALLIHASLENRRS